MSEPVSMVAEAANKKSALDFYLNSAIELPEADRFVSALGGTPHVVIAQNDPVLSVSDGKGRIKYMYQRGEVSPHVGDYVRLAGNLTNVLWSDEANIQVPGYDTLRTVADAAYHWNSPTAYNETMRLPSPWIPVVGDAEIAVSEQKFAHTGNAPAGKDVPAVTVNGYRTTTTKNEVFAAEGGRPGHFVKADMYALINGLPENERADLNLQNVYFSYDVEYFTNLGAYVAGKSGKIYCDDSKNAIKYFDGGLCTDAGMDRNFFIGWNMRSDKGREVGTGAYIVKLKSFVKLDKSGKEAKQEKTSVWGVKRSPEPNTDYLKTNEK